MLVISLSENAGFNERIKGQRDLITNIALWTYNNCYIYLDTTISYCTWRKPIVMHTKLFAECRKSRQ